ncbi:EAL domain-containing protein [Corallincola luteus]|uniref:EAL domain-containing protein n=1 Tax=Corallincola luteus TaxID=1775177 RepID=A0ABY2AQ50_9GAMM|nr:EAL domain-containing protein [Corallincola luteus]TCI05147.1 EAL domain-containing protein [Corallincola luteus]
MILLSYIITAGAMGFAALNALLMAIYGERRQLYRVYALLCFLAACFQVSTYFYHSADSVADAVLALKLQVATITFLYPTFYLFIEYYTKRPLSLVVLTAISVFSLLIFTLNLLEPFGVRFSQVHGLIESAVASESLVRLHAEQSRYGIVVHAFGVLFLAWALWRFVDLLRAAAWRESLLFGIGILLLFVGAVVGALIDSGMIDFVYVIGFGMLIIIVMISVNLAHEARQQRTTMKQQANVLQQTQAESARHQASHLQLAQVVYQSPVPIVITSLDGEVIKQNATSQTFWREELLGINMIAQLSALYPETDLSSENISAQGAIWLPDVPSNQFAAEMALTKENECWLKFRLFVINSPAGSPQNIAIICEDASERHLYTDSLRQIAEGVASGTGNDFYDKMVVQLTKLFDAKYAFIGLLDEQYSQVSTLALSVDGKISNNFSYELVGTPCANVVGNDICCYPKNVQHLFPDDHLLIEMGIESYIGAPMFDEEDKPLGLVVILDTKPLRHTDTVQNILEIFAARTGAELQRRAAEVQVRRMAYEDYLTLLPNRALTYERVGVLIKRLRRSGKLASLYLLDMDHFKNINDVLGHDVGDEVLRALAKQLRVTFADNLFISRVGGDEFVLVDEYNSEPVYVEQLAELVNQPLQVGDHLIDIGASIGVCAFPQLEQTPLDVLRHAELALYQAKKAGRNRHVVYQVELENEAKNRLVIQNALKKALHADQLSLYYQPQLTADGQMFGAEALLRWHDPELGFVSPAEFIPIAEESGLIHALGDWVLQEALAQLKGWLAKGLPFAGHLSINVSPWQFALPNFVEHLESMIRIGDVDPAIITLELTETGILVDVEDTIKKFKRLRSLGIQIAMDDFGTGYSSLAYLRDLPIDILKIDKAFIDELQNSDSSPLTESMIAIGRNMDLHVVAEGVEYDRQAIRLKKLGCTIYQGYLFAKPMSVYDFEQWLAARR